MESSMKKRVSCPWLFAKMHDKQKRDKSRSLFILETVSET